MLLFSPCALSLFLCYLISIYFLMSMFKLFKNTKIKIDIEEKKKALSVSYNILKLK